MAKQVLVSLSLLCLLGAGVGCSSATASDVGSATSDYSSERAATPDIPVFTAGDTVEAYSGRMRVSVGAAAFTDASANAAVNSFDASAPMKFNLVGAPPGLPSIGPGATAAAIYFGQKDDDTVKPGTYSCAAGDANVGLQAYGDGSWTVQWAKTCSVIIDEVSPTEDPQYVRVYGRFTAESNFPVGLSSPLRGAFVADTPLPVRLHP